MESAVASAINSAVTNLTSKIVNIGNLATSTNITSTCGSLLTATAGPLPPQTSFWINFIKENVALIIAGVHLLYAIWQFRQLVRLGNAAPGPIIFPNPLNVRVVP